MRKSIIRKVIIGSIGPALLGTVLLALTGCCETPGDIVGVGTIVVKGAQNGVAWTGPVNFTLTQQTGGSQTYSGTSVDSTFNGVASGNYTIAYVSGGPTGGAPTSITSAATQPVNPNGTTTFTLNWDRVTAETGTILVKAAQNGVAWTGLVNFTLTQQTGGSQTYSDTSVNSTHNGVPVGNYLVAYVSGGPTGGAPTSITSAATQFVTQNGTTTFTLNWDKVAPETGTITVDAMLDGVPGTGLVNFTLIGPSQVSGSSVPQTYGNMTLGTYALHYISGGPPSAIFIGITPSGTQALTSGGPINFRLNFATIEPTRTPAPTLTPRPTSPTPTLTPKEQTPTATPKP